MFVSKYSHTFHLITSALKLCIPPMAHILHALAQHWHLSASQYWQMRLLCSVSLVPFLGVLFLVFFNRRSAPVRLRVTLVKRKIKAFTRPSVTHAPLQPTASPS